MKLNKPHILTIIHTLGDKDWGFRQLQEHTGINSRTLSLRLQFLASDDLIQSIDCHKDKRRKYYQLTERGKKINALLGKFDEI